MIRVGFIWFLFLLSLLTVFKAPVYYLWLVSIVVTEFPWIFIVVTLFLLVWGIGVNKYQVAGAVPGLIALVLFCTPVARAYNVASSLKPKFEAVFGAGTTTPKARMLKEPFRFFKMLAGIGERLAVFTTLTYKASNNLTLDYYKTTGNKKKPCIIVIHGGSWSSGNSRQLPELNTHLIKMGYNIAAINYRLAPKYQSPAAVEDVRDAIIYLKNHSEALLIDTNNFVLLGRSAGGQIALEAAYTLKTTGIKAVISYYAPADMVWGYSVPANPLVLDSRKVMEDYLGGTYNSVPQHYAASSPILAVNKNSVPTLLIHGENDVLVAYEHSRRLDAKLQQLGVKHFLLTLPWATHGCDYTLNGPSGQLATYTVDRFINQVTK
ncbi:acetyl esterase/lipase [Mucilaginibacter gracilis]|uniref:Acetyl esterase/lipase n=1 Tax=Mucilaginibacter gracilis TaxID=423350 RepID=A0A495J9Y4_9SPHI|nr:alpha/beta hydrolase [Mucilaginibacter gracilis]RKR85182.1 acetyl esterase/lipase [Mucilaginibacter gracilis]